MPEITEADYDILVTILDALLERVRGDENHPLLPLLHHVGDVLAFYDGPDDLNSGRGIEMIWRDGELVPASTDEGWNPA